MLMNLHGARTNVKTGYRQFKIERREQAFVIETRSHKTSKRAAVSYMKLCQWQQIFLYMAFCDHFLVHLVNIYYK